MGCGNEIIATSYPNSALSIPWSIREDFLIRMNVVTRNIVISAEYMGIIRLQLVIRTKGGKASWPVSVKDTKDTTSWLI